MSAIRIKVTSLRVVLGLPSGTGTMPAPGGSVKESAQERLKPQTRLEDDAEGEVQRAARADERAGQLEVGARVDEQPAVLVAEAQLAELVETPAGDALILDGQLVRGWWELGCGHVPALTNRYAPSLLAVRKTSL